MNEICHEGKCVDGCETIECGINAKCSFVNGINACNCIEDHIGDPFDVCEKSPCETMPCGVNATCLVVENEAVCKCHENMVGNPLKECWEIGENICEPNPCGPFSKCITDPEPGCLCLEDFYGKPPNCQIGCKGHSTCAENEYCDYDHTCKVGCRNDQSCKSDEYCDLIGSQKCKKGCKSEDDCKENEICEYIGRTCMPGCLLNKNCNEGEYCDHRVNRCVNPCEEPSPCGNFSKCKSIGHSKNVHCTCERGFMPKAGVGCEKKSNNTRISSKNLDCKKYCSKYAECNIVDGKIECWCPDEIFGEFLNPFESCIALPPKPGFSTSACTHAIKPECAVPLSPATLAVLAG